jgi:hypothetical protein
MERLIRRSVVLALLAGCATSPHAPLTAEDHDRKAQHYETTAASIEDECWEDRRNELTVDAPQSCWKAQDIRFLEANEHAATRHRAEAARLRANR